MIVYRKAPGLRLQRQQVPEPPWWSAAILSPYGPKRSAPIAIDYLRLEATLIEKSEVAVIEDASDDFERMTARQPLQGPLLIDATEFAELVFRRGEELVRISSSQRLDVSLLVSTRGALPEVIPEDVRVVIAAWPLELERLEPLFAQLSGRGVPWGIAVPLLYPVTTSLPALSELIASATEFGASFLAPVTLDVDASARRAIAQSLALDERDERYDFLFHADLDAIHTATDRHICALAHEHGMDDFILPPAWNHSSNWNASIILSRTATRMIGMHQDTELAWTLARSARAVANLNKPIARIAAAASLSIVGSLDEVSVHILTDWLSTGRSPYVDRVDDQWRLRRDHGV